ncbi:hypothetical protein PInf_023297 [Phytophthora infestans]|nr:hypothetical protein PInf_023297 [Phytophthora infestans]
MIQEVLQKCHDSLEGGHQGVVRAFHRVKSDYYWIGLYADVEKHVKSCPDCSSSKSRPQLRGYSPGNVLAERPFQTVSMDFVIPHTAGTFGEVGYGFRTSAMSSSLKRGLGKQSDALAWRREINRQDEIALTMAENYQAHNDALSRLEKAAVPRPSGNEHSADPPEASEETDDPARAPPRSLFKIGSRAWLYMERVKPGLTKELAHRWHGPFQIKRKVEEFEYELELPDRSGYRFYPVVHVSRLKAVNEFNSRPSTRLVLDATNEARLDFDEELLPEDSWEPDQAAGECEVEAILDDRTPLSVLYASSK